MLSLRGISNSGPARHGLIALGNFDGVHRGHRAILDELVRQARAAAAPAVAVTFEPHPIQLLAPHRAPPLLTVPQRKAELIAARGVDVLIVLETTPDLLRLTAEEFFDRIIGETLAARGLVEGPNFCFGRDRRGDIPRLQQLCADSGRSLTVVPPVLLEGVTVSSSAIRQALREGRIPAAVAMLGSPYRLSGIVEPGAERGRELGFPTANLGGIGTLLPPDGVYAGIVALPESSAEPSAINRRHACDRSMLRSPVAVHIGSNPTFGEARRKVEAHIVGYQGDLYGAVLDVDLLDRIRETRQFPDRDALIRQLDQDIAAVVARASQESLARGDSDQ